MSASAQIDVGERRAAQAAGRPLRSVFLAVAVFYVSAALLNGTYLHDSAEKREYGIVRSVWVKLTHPLAEVSEFLKLHLLRDQVEKLRKE
jgi:hypothetical protein